MTTIANKNLELGVQRKDFDLVKHSFDNGAKVDYKAGWFFVLACSYGLTSIVELFLEQPHFISSAKKLVNQFGRDQAHLHDGFRFAGANNHLDIIELLHTHPTYQKLGTPEDLVLYHFKDVVKEHCLDSLLYFKNNMKLKENSNFEYTYQNLSNEQQQLLDNVFLYSDLSSLKNNKTITKIKI